jgi:U32 family peptidase
MSPTQNHDPTPELLSPAGNWDCARAAVAAGADAIYFGLPDFNARLRADNFTTGDLPELMDYLHRHGVRGFVAMNTLIFTGELEAAETRLREIAAAKVDALIIQDLGLAWMASQVAPDVEIHASTQMTITSPEGLAFAASILPLHRAVLARELSLTEIERFQKHAAKHPEAAFAPLEVFVHGALCVAYSGQCLTSESLGKRSANRGECAQACRMPYELVVDGKAQDLGEVRYLLSPQDLAAVDMIPGLVAAGVKSFKIEGRLKSPEYVAAITRVYRKALDAAIAGAPSPVDADDRHTMEMMFSRGLSTGWLAGTDHPSLTHGRYGKKRGPLVGRIAACGSGWITLDETTGVPLKPGDGVVFDAGENRDHEQGARIWKIEGTRLLFHRVHSGLDFSRIRPGQLVCKTSDPALETSIRSFWKNAKPAEKKTPLHLHVTGEPGKPLTLHCGDVALDSDTDLTPAEQHPLNTATLTAQFSRLGGTRYELATLTNELTGACHLPVSALNRLRRALVDRLEHINNQNSPINNHQSPPFFDLHPRSTIRDPQSLPTLSILVRSDAQLDAAIESGAPFISCDFEDPRRCREAVERFRASASPKQKILLATPRILKPGETGYLTLLERSKPDGLLLRNLATLEIYRQRDDLLRVGDFSLNTANPLTAKLLREHANLDWLTISYDLNISQVIDLLEAAPPEWFELTLHQHMPLFHMEHCVFCTFMSKGTNYKDCGRPCEKHVVHLRDRVGQLHRLQADVGCRNTLFNGRAQTGANHFPVLRQRGLTRFRIELLDQDKAAAARAIRIYQDLLAGHTTSTDVLDQLPAIARLGVTEGTLAAGV